MTKDYVLECRQCGEWFDLGQEAAAHPGTCGSNQGFDVVDAS